MFLGVVEIDRKCEEVVGLKMFLLETGVSRGLAILSVPRAKWGSWRRRGAAVIDMIVVK